MKIGVISDTHIPDRADRIPAEIINAFRGVDMIVHAGDLAEVKVLEQLRSVCKDVRAVWGNMDPYEVRKQLQEKEVFEVSGRKIGLIHGYGAPLKLIELVGNIFKKDKVDIIIFGHAHCAINEEKDGVLYFNPGSPTDKIYCPYNSYGIIEINDKIEAKVIKI